MYKLLRFLVLILFVLNANVYYTLANRSVYKTDLILFEKEKGTAVTSFEFEVGPNPFADIIRIKLHGDIPESCVIALYNSSGVLVYHNILYTMENPIVITDVADLPNGTYFLKIQFEDSLLESFKMIKK